MNLNPLEDRLPLITCEFVNNTLFAMKERKVDEKKK